VNYVVADLTEAERVASRRIEVVVVIERLRPLLAVRRCDNHRGCGSGVVQGNAWTCQPRCVTSTVSQ
jgi:hypothetical protein